MKNAVFRKKKNIATKFDTLPIRSVQSQKKQNQTPPPKKKPQGTDRTKRQKNTPLSGLLLLQ